MDAAGTEVRPLVAAARPSTFTMPWKGGHIYARPPRRLKVCTLLPQRLDTEPPLLHFKST